MLERCWIALTSLRGETSLSILIRPFPARPAGRRLECPGEAVIESSEQDWIHARRTANGMEPLGCHQMLSDVLPDWRVVAWLLAGGARARTCRKGETGSREGARAPDGYQGMERRLRRHAREPEHSGVGSLQPHALLQRQGQGTRSASGQRARLRG